MAEKPDEKLDEARVREMRELIQEGGADAVERRYPGGTRSPEYARAQRQRAAVRARAEAARVRVVEDQQERERAARAEKAAAAKRADAAQDPEDAAAGPRRRREQQQQHRWGAPPPGDAGPPLTGKALEESRRRVAEAKEQIKRDNEMIAARKTAGQDRDHFQSM